MKIAALAGGVGGAKLADGLARILPPEELCVIVNTGDDFDYLGLKICPDLDTVCYTLAGLANPETGWGRKAETWAVLTELSNLGSPSWFHIGDMDLATHLERTRLLKQEEKLSTVTRMLCEKWGVKHRVFPMTDETVATKVITASGSELDFQEYFVRDQCNPTVRGFRFAGIESASPAAGVLAVLEEADLVVICPSNPWVSIGPIIGIQSIREVLNRKPVIAVSPIIGGKTIKGPAAKMYQELGFEPSSAAVARHYGNLLQGFVIDSQDGALSSQISQWGIICWVTDTIMIRQDDRIRLARDIIHFGSKMIGREQK